MGRAAGWTVDRVGTRRNSNHHSWSRCLELKMNLGWACGVQFEPSPGTLGTFRVALAAYDMQDENGRLYDVPHTTARRRTIGWVLINANHFDMERSAAKNRRKKHQYGSPRSSASRYVPHLTTCRVHTRGECVATNLDKPPTEFVNRINEACRWEDAALAATTHWGETPEGQDRGEGAAMKEAVDELRTFASELYTDLTAHNHRSLCDGASSVN